MEGAQFLLEAVLVLLLGATLFHALRLERALGVLKRDRAVLEELVAGFNESTRAAEAGIDRLRGATDGAGRQIARQIEIAQRLRDDLGFLTERGESLAERLESGIRSARMLADQQAMAPPPMQMMAGRGFGVPVAQSSPQAGTQQNGMQQNGMLQNGTQHNGAMAAGMMQSGARQPSAMELGAMHPGAMQPGPMQPGASQYAAPQHAMPQPMAPQNFAPQHLPQQTAPHFAAAQKPAEEPAMMPVYAAPEPPAGPRLRSEAERDLLRALRAAR